MKIKIKTEKLNLFFAVPTVLVFSDIGLLFMKICDKYGDFKGVTFKDMRNIRKTIRRIRKKHKNWNLVEVDSTDGTCVRVKL